MANYFCTDSVEEQVDFLTDKVKDLNTKKLDKAAVVQATGTGTDVVMSQKAVTDVINENLQTINTEISNKLTKPTNPSAESAVTMLANGTVGTKPLSEIGGGGKLYKHSIRLDFANEGGLIGAIIYIVDYRTNIIEETNPQICNKQVCYCKASNNIGDELYGICPVLVDSNNRAKILGVLDNTSTNAPEILNASINFLKIKDTVTEL